MLKSLFRDISKSYVLSAAICLVIGTALVLFPMASVTLIIRVIGMVVAFNGVVAIARYFSEQFLELKLSLYLGIVEILLGIILNLYALELVTLVPIIMGIILLVTSINNIMKSIECQRAGDSRWFTLCIPAAAIGILGIVLMAYPFDSSSLLIRLVGVGFLVNAFNEYIKAEHVAEIGKSVEGMTPFDDPIIDAEVEKEETLK